MPDPTAGSAPQRTTSELLALKVIDLATYVLALVVAVAVPLGALELAAFGGLVFTKWLLFFFGGALATYASLKLRPVSPKRRAASATGGPNSGTVGDEELRWFQRAVAALPPARWTNLSARERFSPNAKLLAGSLLMIATSWLLEFVLDVGFGG